MQTLRRVLLLLVLGASLAGCAAYTGASYDPLYSYYDEGYYGAPYYGPYYPFGFSVFAFGDDERFHHRRFHRDFDRDDFGHFNGPFVAQRPDGGHSAFHEGLGGRGRFHGASSAFHDGRAMSHGASVHAFSHGESGHEDFHGGERGGGHGHG